MSLTIAAQLYAQQEFKIKCALASASKGKEILIAGTNNQLELGFAKAIIKNPESFKDTCAAVMLNAHNPLHATANPSDQTFLDAAIAAWPAYLLFN